MTKLALLALLAACADNNASPCPDAGTDTGFTTTSDHVATWTPICDATSNCAEADQLLPHYQTMTVVWNLNGSAVNWRNPDIALPEYGTKPFWGTDYSIEFPRDDGVTFWFRLVADGDMWTGVVPYTSRKWRVEVAR